MRPVYHFDAAGHACRVPRLSAMDQFALWPVLKAAAAAMAASSEAQVMALAKVPEALLGPFLASTLGGVEVRDGEGWRRFWSEEDEEPAPPGASLNEVMTIALAVLLQNLAPILAHESPKIDRPGGSGPSYKAVELPDGKLWLMRPVLRGLCQHVHLIDGTLDLADVALMNDAITVQDENESRARKAAEDARAK